MFLSTYLFEKNMTQHLHFCVKEKITMQLITAPSARGTLTPNTLASRWRNRRAMDLFHFLAISCKKMEKRNEHPRFLYSNKKHAHSSLFHFLATGCKKMEKRKAVQGVEGLRAWQTALVKLTPTSSPPRNTPSPLFASEKCKVSLYPLTHLSAYGGYRRICGAWGIS